MRLTDKVTKLTTLLESYRKYSEGRKGKEGEGRGGEGRGREGSSTQWVKVGSKQQITYNAYPYWNVDIHPHIHIQREPQFLPPHKEAF